MAAKKTEEKTEEPEAVTIEEQPRETMQSASIDKLFPALVKAQAEFPTVELNAEGQAGQRKYPYANLEAVMAAIRPTLAKHELAVMHQVIDCHVVTKVLHSSGQWIASAIEVQGVQPQALGSEITYYRRYTLSGLFGLVTGEDDDGAAAQGGEPASHAAKRAEQHERRAPSGQRAGKGITDKQAWKLLLTNQKRCEKIGLNQRGQMNQALESVGLPMIPEDVASRDAVHQWLQDNVPSKRDNPDAFDLLLDYASNGAPPPAGEGTSDGDDDDELSF